MTPPSGTLRVVIVGDAAVATRERELIQRLQIGLADEGVRVSSAFPRGSVDAPPSSDLFARAIAYEPSTFPWGRARRVSALADALRTQGDSPRPVDVVHAIGEGSWRTAFDLAHRVSAGLVVSIWSAHAAHAVARRRMPDAGAPAPLLTAPDAALERVLRRELEDSPLRPADIRVVPWGVHSHGAPRDLLRAGRIVSIVIAGSGHDAAAYEAALAGLAKLSGRSEDIMIFADAEAAQRAHLPTVARHLSLSDRFTLVPEIEARRELVLAADFILLPEAVGEHRSLTLDAMASGTVVVALADPLVSCLIEGRTARVIPRPDPELWAGSLAGLLDRRDRAAALADSARDYIRQNHRPSAHVASVLDAYEWLSGRESIPFEPAAAAPRP